MSAIYPFVGALAWAPDGVVEWVAPLDGNEFELGRNWLQDPVHGLNAREAVRAGQLVLLGPLGRSLSGAEWVLSQPVYEGVSVHSGFAGLVLVSLDWADLLAGLPLHIVLDGSRVDYRLHQSAVSERPSPLQSALANRGQPVIDSAPDDAPWSEANSVSVPFSALNGQWQLTLKSTWGPMPMVQRLFWGQAALLFAWLVSVLVYLQLRRMSDARQAAGLEHEVHASQLANEAKDRFLANMSHELRSPFNLVLGMLQLLRQTPLNVEQHKQVRTAHRAATSLLHLLDDLLDIARIEAGDMRAKRVTFRPRALLAEVVEVLGAQGAKQNLTLQLATQLPDHVRVQGDARHLRQVVFNLVGNALKFTRQGGVTVALDGEPVGDLWHLSFAVKDTGVGISPADQDRIFERFQQVQGGLARPHGGLGLGLSIARHLVKSMGGGADGRQHAGGRQCVQLHLDAACFC